MGFGDGDMLRRIARWAKSSGLAADLIGVDLNPRSEAAARAVTPVEMPIDYAPAIIATSPAPFDVVICSLVAHHMTDSSWSFSAFMEGHAPAGWFVNDLHRHGFPYSAFRCWPGFSATHPIVRNDGQLRSRAGFLPPNGGDAGRAGIKTRPDVRRFPFRLCVERLR